MNWSYIAGFFDGEGSITHNGKGFRVTIPQTNQAVLQEIKKFVGYGNVVAITKRKSHWKDAWVYYIAKQTNVYSFIQHISRFVIVKEEAITKVMPELYHIIVQQKLKEKTYTYRKKKGKELRKKGFNYREIGKFLQIDWGYARRLILDIR